MELPLIHICDRHRAERIKRRGWSAVLTLADPGQRAAVAFHRWPRPDHLILRCEDLDAPMNGIITPTIGQMEQILEFGRRHTTGPMLIHCNAGISRSTASALGILADRLGPGYEAEALAQLVELRPPAVPNLLMIQHADVLLGRGGQLLQIVTEWDQGRPWNVWRREANRRAVLDIDDRDLPPMPPVPGE